MQKKFLELKERLNKIYSKHTGKSIDEISLALERDNFMTAEEAKKFGLIDSVVEKGNKTQYIASYTTYDIPLLSYLIDSK